MQPVVVRPAPGQPGRYELVAGERRWRAAQLLGETTIPAIVRVVDDRTAAEWALIENLQREDLNPMDRAAAFRRLAEDYGLSHQAIADRVGLDRSTVSNLFRLNELDEFTADAVRTNKLSLGHAKALLGCVDPARRAELAATTVRSGWSVRRTEQAVLELARRSAHVPSPTEPPSAAALQRADLGRRIGEHLGTRVAIEAGKSRGSGRLLVDFYSIEQFEGLLRRMGIADHVLHDLR